MDISSLPEEMILKIFSYLRQNELGQIARVCKRWNMLSRSPILWKNVNVRFLSSHGSQNAISESFVSTLPSCVTCIRFDFGHYKNWNEPLDFKEFCLRLQEKCPHLKVLFLIESKLSDNIQVVVDLCTQFLQDVRILIFHRSTFSGRIPRREFGGTSKIEVLDFYGCYLRYCDKVQFSRMPCLNQLCLSFTYVEDSWFEGDTSYLNNLHVLDMGFTLITSQTFQAIRNHGLNLRELYLCNADIEDSDLNLNNSMFPYLKTICLSNSWGVTCEGVITLIQSCPSLEKVYVTQEMAASYAVHPFALADIRKIKIVKSIFNCCEHKKKDYF